VRSRPRLSHRLEPFRSSALARQFVRSSALARHKKKGLKPNYKPLCVTLYFSIPMSARDFFHQVVKTALIKDGWQITHDPLSISFGGVDMSIDLGAEKLIGAKKQNQEIAVEIKSFLAQSSAISEFHTALGQFINYRGALRREDPNRTLYLAVPSITYNNFFQLEFPQLMIEENQLKLIIYKPEDEVIVQWIN
jgi:XisH protein